MEKVLRKVNVKDRLPEKLNRYYCITKSGGPIVLEFDIPTSNWFTNQGNIVAIPEYWYEEVSLEDLIKDKQPTLKEQFMSSKLFAKERYEKALEFLTEYCEFTEVHGIVYGQNITKTALKMAAGLKEDKV